MDTREYIESGKLENYVLGICSPEEKQEVECMARIFPEVKKELDSIRVSFEQYVLANKVNPPASVKSKIFEEIEKDEKPAAKPETKVISIESRPKTDSGWGIKVLAAASIALFIISGFIAYNLLQKNDALTAQINTLQSDQQAANTKFEELNKRFENSNEQMAVMSNLNSMHVVMKGTAMSPQSVASVYWNKESKEVFMAVNSLPQPPAGMQYQLWGIVSGKPVDLGVFDMPAPGDSTLHKMKPVDGAVTFAVTLEKAGGSPTPTLDQMYVAGNI